MDIIVLLQQAVLNHASDIFVVAGLPVSYRANGRICREKEEKLMPPQTKECVEELYKLAGGRDIRVLEEKGDDDFSFAVPGLSRFRVSAYKQRGALSAVIRVITFELPEPNEIGIPDPVMSFYNLSKGLVLVTGPAGSGKSTTLACLVDKINHSMEKHIITLEDPIDVAMTAAETGHLVFSTLHTIGAANTVDRIIDVFPANQQRQIAVQLSMVLQAVISQQLVPTVDGKQVPVFEIMTITPAIRNMIRDNKVPQIDGIVYSSNKEEMHSMDFDLLNLYKDGRITAETALSYASNPEMLKKKL